MNRNLIIAGAAMVALYVMNRNQGSGVSASTPSAGSGFSAGGGGGSGLAAPATGAIKKPVQDVVGVPATIAPPTVFNETAGEFEYPQESGTGSFRGKADLELK